MLITSLATNGDASMVKIKVFNEFNQNIGVFALTFPLFAPLSIILASQRLKSWEFFRLLTRSQFRACAFVPPHPLLLSSLSSAHRPALTSIDSSLVLCSRSSSQVISAATNGRNVRSMRFFISGPKNLNELYLRLKATGRLLFLSSKLANYLSWYAPEAFQAQPDELTILAL